MITDLSQIIDVDITEEMRVSAKRTSNVYKDNLSNSIRRGDGTYAGCLGEEMVKKVFPFLERINSYDYDFRYMTPSGAFLTFDVKTKERTVPPVISYDCSVNLMNGKQNVDYYIFAQVMSTYDMGWLLGIMKADDFFKKAQYHPVGSVDPSNNYTFKCDTYNMPINQLRPINVNKYTGMVS